MILRDDREAHVIRLPDRCINRGYAMEQYFLTFRHSSFCCSVLKFSQSARRVSNGIMSFKVVIEDIASISNYIA